MTYRVYEYIANNRVIHMGICDDRLKDDLTNGDQIKIGRHEATYGSTVAGLTLEDAVTLKRLLGH